MTFEIVSRMGIPARLLGVGQECPTYKNKSREMLVSRGTGCVRNARLTATQRGARELTASDAFLAGSRLND